MYKTSDELLKSFPQAFQDDVKAEADALHLEYDTLQSLRKARKMTQKQLANQLNIEQVSVSKLESRSDMLLSTLNAYITAIGGELKLQVNFPNKSSVSLRIADI